MISPEPHFEPGPAPNRIRVGRSSVMKRREFASTSLAAAAMSASSALAQNNPTYDLVLKGGHVIDMANQINRQMDVALLDGKIASVQQKIPDSAGKRTINVTGYYVVPGLIDLHICCY